MRSPAQQRALDRLELWRERYAERLASFHPDVRAEIELAVRDRFLAGNFAPMSDAERRHCVMRVASRMRIKRYGPCDGDEETARQLRECLAALDGKTMEVAA